MSRRRGQSLVTLHSTITKHSATMGFVKTIALAVLLFPLYAFSQVPVDNPYATRYGAIPHWTSKLKWSNASNARTIKGLVSRQDQVDSVRLHQTISEISRQGGGVLYFPAGTYRFDFDVKLEPGVILRGADPKGITDAKKAGYDPPTKLLFKRYKPVVRGAGVPHSAFKKIYGDTTGVENAGLVNLDLNRATISFFVGGYYEVHTLRGPSHWSKYYHNNIIIFGVRQNNAATPSPEVPTQEQIAKGNAWQRWPYAYVGNINLDISYNCVVANCRLNDAPTDDFEQPGYVDDMYADLKGDEARFSFTDHPGICLNYWKIVTNGKGQATGRWSPYGFFPYTPRYPGFESLDSLCEPLLTFKGSKEIRDNFVAAKIRHDKIATHVASAIIKDNILVDDDSLNIRYFVDDSGKRSLFASTPNNVLKHFRKHEEIFGNDSLRYQLHRPDKLEKGKKYPLIVFLHAEDLYGRDNTKQLAQFIPLLCTKENLEKYPCFIFAPQEKVLINSWLEVDDNTPTATLVNTRKVLDKLLTDPNIDPDRVWVIGLSRGGTAAWKTAAGNPGLFAAVVALDGLENFLTEHELDRLKNVGLWTASPKSYGFLSLFLITRINAIRLNQRGHKAIFRLTPGWNREEMVFSYGKDREFLPWLFSQRRAQL